MTNDELARQYREAMTCDRTEPPDVEGWWMLRRASMDEPQIIWYAARPESKQWLSGGCLFGRCPLPDPAACEDDEPATKEWIDSLTVEGWLIKERFIPFFLYCESHVTVAGVLTVGPQSKATRGDVRRVARVFGVELREAAK